MMNPEPCPESARQQADARRTENWKRWGPYLSERQWGTVREDYSETGDCWTYFPHDHARSRAYRWGEDGLLGWTDRSCRLCFATALWNGKDPILKERLFGVSGPEGNHGEDAKECWYYLDALPTHSYMRGLYKYPLSEYPYARLVEEGRRRGKGEPELELEDTGAFEGGRLFDVEIEYAKATPDDVLVRITARNRGPDAAPLDVLPTLWFRNTWSWGRGGEGHTRRKPLLRRRGGRWIGAGISGEAGAPGAPLVVETEHETLGRHVFSVDVGAGAIEPPALLFTENETNFRRLYGMHGGGPAKDAFHEHVVHGRRDALSARDEGTKAAARLRFLVPAGGAVVVRARLSGAGEDGARAPFGPDFEEVFARRRADADIFYAGRISRELSEEERCVARQAYAGLLWSKQFYHIAVKDWLDGDPAQPPPPEGRRHGRNHDWGHLYNRDVISMPDKWEYPWYAAWDLAFHMIPMARIDPWFAKSQLVLLLREWYMHPNGQIPAYEFAFGDVNPPVHAWAVWRVYKMTGARGQRDRVFLERCFQKLLINFTWWVNRKDVAGKHIFAGGFLGLDNIGVFDRSRPLPTGGHLEQADGTAWMAFYCATMLSMALELAQGNPAYEDAASKFFEHFVAIVDAMNTVGGTGLWNAEDGFYYDQLHVDGCSVPLKIRSMVGLIPLFAVEVIEEETLARLPGFAKRMRWFLENRKDLGRHISYVARAPGDAPGAAAGAPPGAAGAGAPGRLGQGQEQGHGDGQGDGHGQGQGQEQGHGDGQGDGHGQGQGQGHGHGHGHGQGHEERHRHPHAHPDDEDVLRAHGSIERQDPDAGRGHGHRLLAIPSRERLESVLRYLLDEKEFLSPFGIRSLSAAHGARPYSLEAGGERYAVAYTPGESDTWLFGGNSNWRGPVWFPVNYLLIEALERYHHFYGHGFSVECPTGSGQRMTLLEVSIELSRRLSRIFLPDDDGRRPCHGGCERYADDPAWSDLVLFHEYFHGDHGRGLGASHQTGWTALVARCLEALATVRRLAKEAGISGGDGAIEKDPGARAEISRRYEKARRERP